MSSQCPPADVLSRYAAGALSDAEAGTVDTHIGCCTTCLERLGQLDTPVDSVVHALLGLPAAPPASPSLAAAVAAVLGGPKPAAPVGLETGAVIGGYRVAEELGRGGMGRVYRAAHPRLEQDVALKVLRPGADSAPILARFEAERQALARMDHPNIARVLDGGATADGRPFFAMELVRGVAITKYCDDHRLGLRPRLELFVEVCRAVQHAHQKGIIHRDLKPSNVLVAEYDGTPAVKIIDFGIAKPVDGHAGAETEVGVLVGTPESMSPEQADLKAHDVDTRTDVYALGGLLYELLTGDTPFERKRLRAAGVFEVLRIVREEEPPPPSARLAPQPAKAVRGDLDWITLKALEKDRARRYETAAALADDVERHLNTEPVRAGPPGVGYRLGKFVRRNRVPVLAAAVVLVALAGGLAASIHYGRQASANAKLYRSEYERAEEHLADARRAVEDYFTAVSESTLLDVPGLQPLRRELLLSARTYYQKFLTARANDPALRVELAAAHNRLGAIDAQIGAGDAAVASYEQALAVAGGAESPEARAVRSAAHLGLALRKQAQTNPEAVAHFDAALALAEPLAREQPDSHRAATHLSRVRFRRGVYAEKRGQRQQAVDEYEQVLATLGPWRERRPDDANVLEPLAVTNLALSLFDYRLGRLEPALARLGEARGLAERALKARPGNASVERVLADIEGWIGNMLASLKRNAEAAEPLARAVDRLTRLSAANPEVPTLRLALAQTLMRQGKLFAATGDRPAAVAASERGCAVAAALVEADPGNAEFRQLYGDLQSALGLQLIEAGRSGDGFASLDRSLATLEPLARAEKATPFDLTVVANAHFQVGLARETAGQAAKAAEAFAAAIALQRRAVERLPKSPFLKRDLATMLGHRADALDRTDRHADADAARAEARKLAGP